MLSNGLHHVILAKSFVVGPAGTSPLGVGAESLYNLCAAACSFSAASSDVTGLAVTILVLCAVGLPGHVEHE